MLLQGVGPLDVFFIGKHAPESTSRRQVHHPQLLRLEGPFQAPFQPSTSPRPQELGKHLWRKSLSTHPRRMIRERYIGPWVKNLLRLTWGFLTEGLARGYKKRVSLDPLVIFLSNNFLSYVWGVMLHDLKAIFYRRQWIMLYIRRYFFTRAFIKAIFLKASLCKAILYDGRVVPLTYSHRVALRIIVFMLWWVYLGRVLCIGKACLN